MNWFSFFEQSAKARQMIPRLQSHRGYRERGASENTLASLQAAADEKYPMVEIDVRLTADQVVILHHDPDIQGIFIQKKSFSELSKLKDLTRLEDVFRWLLAVDDLKINIELKTNQIRSDLEKAVAELIQRYQLSDRVIISSFNPLALAYFKKYHPDIVRALLLSFEQHPENKWFLKAMIFNRWARPQALHLRYQDFNLEKLSWLLPKVPVVLWTCNHSPDVEPWFRQGIHGVISDSITPSSGNLKN